MRHTLDSVIAQSLPPALWVIVDDGSSDGTGAILEEYSKRHDWIRVVTREDRGARKVGPGVIDAFYAGLDTIDLDDFGYLCKLDMDLILPERYFEELIDRMLADPRLGNCSGKPYYEAGGEMVSEGLGDENAGGFSKFYRVECFREIGGFVREVMWDGIDGHRCRQLGWIAVSWDEESLRVNHLRPMGSSHKGILTGRKRHGFGQWFMGTGPVYMLASAVFRMAHPPYVLGGLAMMTGYLSAMLRGVPRYEDPEFRKFLRRFQWACLIRGKPRATTELNQTQERTWSERQKQQNRP